MTICLSFFPPFLSISLNFTNLSVPGNFIVFGGNVGLSVGGMRVIRIGVLVGGTRPIIVGLIDDKISIG